MKHYIYSVHDVKAEAFLRPFFVPTHGLAMRSFENEVKNPDSPMYQNAEDYTLFQLGEFDDDTGKFETLMAPKSVLSGVQVLAKSLVKSAESAESQE